MACFTRHIENGCRPKTNNRSVCSAALHFLATALHPIRHGIKARRGHCSSFSSIHQQKYLCVLAQGITPMCEGYATRPEINKIKYTLSTRLDY